MQLQAMTSMGMGMSMSRGVVPRRPLLRAGTAGAAVLVGAAALAIVWANVPALHYEGFWQRTGTVRIGPWSASLDLRTWVNSGLMTLFFLVVGLEARSELDLGDLRDRRRLLLPVLAGMVGMALPVAIFLAVNHGGAGVHGWGAAMSSDTALALGAFALVARDAPERVRTFVLTVFVVDDLVALVVIAVAYSGHVRLPGLAVAVVAYGLLVASRRLLPQRYRAWAYAVLTLVTWAGLLSSGIDPVVAGLAAGLATSAYTPSRRELEEATKLVRLFREQPSPELARSATRSLTATLSANARLRSRFQFATSYLIVPLFALANAGIVINGSVLSRALRSPITIGIVVAYVVGKPFAVVVTAWLTERLSGGSLRPSVGWGAVLGSGTIAGIGFTVSLLIADLAFTGQALDEAKIGTLVAAVAAALVSLLVYRVIDALPGRSRTRALLGTADRLVDLAEPVDFGSDHVRGTADASVTIVEYGDFECPWTSMAGPTTEELLAENRDIRYVWRHLPLRDIHPHAQLAAEAAEAAAGQGAFWEMHELLLSNQDKLGTDHVLAYATQLGLDLDRFRTELDTHHYAGRVSRDISSADRSGVAGTPTFFINGQRHDGAQDLATLSQVIGEARAQALAI
jgi:Na+/H+ antiporter NhaA